MNMDALAAMVALAVAGVLLWAVAEIVIIASRVRRNRGDVSEKGRK